MLAKGAATPGSFTHDRAVAAAKVSAERRAERKAAAAAEPDEYLAKFFDQERPSLVKDLMDAAKGRGRWSNLPVDKQLAALFRALEYAHGKPTSKAPAPAPQNGSQELEGLVIG